MFRNDYDTFIKLYVKFYRTDRFFFLKRLGTSKYLFLSTANQIVGIFNCIQIY